MPLVEINDLQIDYVRDGRRLRAVDHLNLEIEAGTMVGLVGESGSGKSTLALSLLGLLPHNAITAGGTIDFNGICLTDLSEREWNGIRGRRIGMVFQGAMNTLNPVRRVVDQVVETVLAHEPNIGKSGGIQRATELLSLVGIPSDRHRSYPHEYSGGMRQRAGIALALSGRPDLLIADEPVTALDVIVQAQILSLLEELQQVLGLTVLFITHDLGVVARLCHRVVVMYAAEIVEDGTTTEVFEAPKHPYSQLLLQSVPSFVRGRGQSRSIPGAPASLLDPPEGCRFHPRCPNAMDICSTEPPRLKRFSDTRVAACHLYREDGDVK
jgi:oligopeptide/dipeptide ABC transporter ATP-binding protein